MYRWRRKALFTTNAPSPSTVPLVKRTTAQTHATGACCEGQTDGTDFVLANRKRFLDQEEEEKIAYFTGERGIGIDNPTKIYRSSGVQSAISFLDKVPIFIPAELIVALSSCGLLLLRR